MKKLKIILLSIGMALCAGGAVGTALAAVTKHQATSDGAGLYDKAIVLYWGSDSSSATLDDMDELQSGVAQYRHLVVSPKSSKSVTGTVSVNFTLSTVTEGLPAGKTATLAGLTVKVYEVSSESAITDENVGSLVPSGTLKCTMDSTHLTGSATFTVSTGANVHETVKHYAIEVNFDDSGLGQNDKLSGQLTINQTFNA